ncbi:hypothetical protein LJB78_00260 [Bacteroidales bacterium OttesenSCG-928-J16]|nr:hypothetical protein [Bacteroidales bacterium OttesenSCG-928-J16]
MNNSEERLRKELKQLVVLLKKVQERNANMDFLSEQDQMMLKHLDLFIKNFDQAEVRLPPEFTGDMADSFIEMIRQLTESLREELDEAEFYIDDDGYFDFDDDSDKFMPIPTTDELIKQSDEAIPMKHRIMMAIQQVDERLKEGNFDDSTTDELLDRRIELLDQLKMYS